MDIREGLQKKVDVKHNKRLPWKTVHLIIIFLIHHNLNKVAAGFN